MGRSTRTTRTTQQVDPEAWTRALELAGGDRRRLEVTGPGTVMVRNQPVAR